MTDIPSARLQLSAVQHRRRRSVAMVLLLAMAVALTTGSIWIDGGVERAMIESGGLVLLMIAVVGRSWCSLYIGGRKATELVVTGPYSVTRNPLYLFSFLGALGVGAQSGSLTLSLLFLVGALVVFLPLIRREEAFLCDAMPDAFAAYGRRTPRLWPNLSLWRSPDEIAVRPGLFLRTLADGLPFLLAWPIFEGVETLQNAGLLPVLLRWI